MRVEGARCYTWAGKHLMEGSWKETTLLLAGFRSIFKESHKRTNLDLVEHRRRLTWLRNKLALRQSAISE